MVDINAIRKARQEFREKLLKDILEFKEKYGVNISTVRYDSDMVCTQSGREMGRCTTNLEVEILVEGDPDE